MANFWNDAKVFNINSIKRYASGYPLDKACNPQIKVLSGEWDFLFCKSVYDIPEDYHKTDYDHKDFGKIKVPSNWQIKGYDIPIYTNFVYPKAVTSKNLFRIPHIKAGKNSAGCYITYFDLDSDVLDKNIFVKFEGVNSCAEVYVNGNFVGYSEDTFDFQEYDITPFVKKGKNKLSVTVYRYCTGSYLEDQDMWRLSGIFRDVVLIFKPKVEIADFFARSYLTDNYAKADFALTAEITSKGGTINNGSLKLALYDKEDNEVFVEEIKVDTLSDEQRQFFDIKKRLDDIKLWSHEDPYLYTVDLELYDNKTLVDKRRTKFGFRSVEIKKMENGKGPFILLNGKPLKFCGVNRHEFHSEYGHAVPEELIKKDLELCLKYNITAIRTSHYPNSEVFYRLCDEMGILVMCENNLETHGLAFLIPRNSRRWTEHCVYRVKNMIHSFKNHACIVSWSLGNESGFGKAFYAMREAALAIDDTRFIHYEPDTSGKVSDVLSEMYAKLEKMPLIGENKPITHCIALWNPFGVRMAPHKYKHRPFIQCEYSHAMGNSLGNFSDYWDMFKKYDRLAGGFFWDFADQAIKYVNEKGVTEWRYGGDFGDKPNSGNFAFNGIFRADRLPNPSLYEVKKQYQQIDFSYEAGKLSLYNRFLFTDISVFGLRVIYLNNGKETAVKEYSLPSAKYAQTATVDIGMPFDDSPGEKSIIAEVYLKQAKGCLEKGHAIAYEQFIVKPYDFELPALGGDCEYADNEWEIIVKCGNLRVIIDKKTGAVTSIDKNGKEILRSPIKLNFYRATIDNDRMASVNIKLVQWLLGTFRFKKAEKTLKPSSIKTEKKDGIVYVTIDWSMKCLKFLQTVYSIGQDGIDFGLKVISKYEMERYGFTFGLYDKNALIEFYGKGPFENYCDRATAALLKEYQGKAENFLHDYLMPQENGNHTQVRYARIKSKDSLISLKADKAPFEMSVHPYTKEMLDSAKHLHELEEADYLTVNVDGRQRGVGGDVPAVAMLKPHYKILPRKEHKLQFRLIVE